MPPSTHGRRRRDLFAGDSARGRKEFVAESCEEVRECFAAKREDFALRIPPELVAAGHGRHPDLAYWRIGRHHELRFPRLFEDHVQDAVLKFYLELLLVGE